MGLSLSYVDLPYLHKVVCNIDADRVRWKISYFDDLDGLRARVAQLHIPSHLVDYALLAEF
jgi:hypothetical protein